MRMLRVAGRESPEMKSRLIVLPLSLKINMIRLTIADITIEPTAQPDSRSKFTHSLMSALSINHNFSDRKQNYRDQHSMCGNFDYVGKRSMLYVDKRLFSAHSSPEATFLGQHLCHLQDSPSEVQVTVQRNPGDQVDEQ
jgi:hypothetical protein